MNYRSRKLLDLCRGQPCMLQLPCCTGGGDDTVACHSNQQMHGKGMSEKSGDNFTVPGCAACHRELDQGITMNRSMKFDAWNYAYFRWQRYLWEKGLVKVAA